MKHKRWTRHDGPRYLVISGVNISRSVGELPLDSPQPDYIALREALRPDVIDMQTIESLSHPLIAIVRKRLGPQWGIACAALLKARRYDAIIATGEDVGLPLALLGWMLLRRLPLILTCHNIATRRPAFYLGKLRVGPVVRVFQCLSGAQARILITRYGIPCNRIQVIAWHVDHDFFRPRQGVERHQICSAGMASRDYATLVSAMRDIPVDVKIAADSPWFRQALNVSAEEATERVEVRSYGTYDALRQLYAESLFVVVPLLDVEFSAGYTVILEAMAMGKAIIVTRIKQQDDFVVEGWNGFYVEPGNVGQLRERITFLLDHPEEAKRLGANGRALVEDRFTLRDYVRRMSETLQDIGAAPAPITAAPVSTND